jgi:uncharacterized membrane protein (Fun14 family)
MQELFGSLSGPLAELGFGGVAGFIVGYATKKVAKVVAFGLGVLFIAIQVMAYYGLVEVHWDAVQSGAEEIWKDQQGATLADRLWHIITYNLPFGGGFIAGFAMGARRG